MALNFDDNGNLQEGIHNISLNDFEVLFGLNEHRKKLIQGLKKGLQHLADCGCQAVYIDGSFVTQKENPNDFDLCWDATGVDLNRLVTTYPILVDFSNHRSNQKNEYYGEFFPAHQVASVNPYAIFIDFFQKDRDGNKKGIVQITLK